MQNPLSADRGGICGAAPVAFQLYGRPPTGCSLCETRGVRVTMLLADFAQVSDGKLTVVGGGWSLTGPEPVPFGIAILIRVPWDQANQRHVMRLELLDADGIPVEIETDDGDAARRLLRRRPVRGRAARPG